MSQPEDICVPDYVAEYVLDYQLEEFKHAFSGRSIRGARVVEIGGDFHMVSARLFAANGATQVITTSLANSFSAEPLPAGVCCEPVDFSKVAVAENSVDLVYGVAVLEHLPDVDAVAQTIFRILSQDGVAHLHGCPLWAGPDGHHVWLYENQIEGFEAVPIDPSRPLYCFNDRARNPIPDWAHLVHAPEELVALLVKSAIPSANAAAAVDFVYNSNGRMFGSASNRLSANEIIRRFGHYFDVEIDRIVSSSPENEHFLKARKWFTEDDLRTAGLRLRLTKRKNLA